MLAVSKSQMVISMDLRQRRADAVIADLTDGDWQRLSCGDGAHGQRLYDWAAIDIRPWREPDRGHWLLARRLITDPDDIPHRLLHPELSSRDWEPRFADYLCMSFTNATAFSPTDVMPLVRWAKMAVFAQSVVSLVTIVLVIARAVGLFQVTTVTALPPSRR